VTLPQALQMGLPAPVRKLLAAAPCQPPITPLPRK
jgi:hypothetical protein